MSAMLPQTLVLRAAVESYDRSNLRNSTHMTVVSTRRELPLHRLPFYTEHPALVPRENMRRRFGEEIPQSGVAVSCTRRQEVPGWREGCT